MRILACSLYLKLKHNRLFNRLSYKARVTVNENKELIKQPFTYIASIPMDAAIGVVTHIPFQVARFAFTKTFNPRVPRLTLSSKEFIAEAKYTSINMALMRTSNQLNLTDMSYALACTLFCFKQEHRLYQAINPKMTRPGLAIAAVSMVAREYYVKTEISPNDHNERSLFSTLAAASTPYLVTFGFSVDKNLTEFVKQSSRQVYKTVPYFTMGLLSRYLALESWRFLNDKSEAYVKSCVD